MDFWARLLGGSHESKKPATNNANDPQSRFVRFQRVLASIHHICSRPRNTARDASTLDELQKHFERLTQLVRDESRAPAPHLCLQHAASQQIFVVVNRAASVSFHEGCIRAAVALAAALIDSEEEDFLSSAPFAKSLMRLVTRVVDGGGVLISMQTETTILELLFTIAAKIRLQPEILPFWFTSVQRPQPEDVFLEKESSFVGLTSKNDFPLCYLLIDRVHHEGRIGDFARTGLLYIFEATGRSLDLEAWIVSSDLPTLMASGLGALFSQLSRELSILHPDATLPAVLSMSDYSTTHSQATAESAFSEKHQAHMTTFLSYLAFWQDVLDHCKSADVKQTLLDHFQILFLRQLLYPSILQSSDTDAGSSVAVLTYLTAMMESLEYPDLIHNMLSYLLAISDKVPEKSADPTAPIRPSMPSRSPTALKRRESLMLLTSRRDPDAVEPSLFNVVDLIQNGLVSNSAQTVFAALKLTSTIIVRQKKYAFHTILKVEAADRQQPARTLGALELEADKYLGLASQLHDYGLDYAYAGPVDDIRIVVEAQASLGAASTGSRAAQSQSQSQPSVPNCYKLLPEQALLRALLALLRGFFTNSIDVNLALTQALIAIACCTEICLDGWLALTPSSYTFAEESSPPARTWQSHLDDDDHTNVSMLQHAARQPAWSADNAPSLYTILASLADEFETVRSTVPTLDQLIADRKNMLQAASIDAPIEIPLASSPASPRPAQLEPTSHASPRGHSRSSSATSQSRGRGRKGSSRGRDPIAPSPSALPRPADSDASRASASRAIFQPPSPEAPSTTDILLQKISFAPGEDGQAGERSASLNHLLTNVIVLQEFVLELVAVLQVRAAVLGEAEVRFS